MSVMETVTEAVMKNYKMSEWERLVWKYCMVVIPTMIILEWWCI
jgi:hypothetical protein